MVGSGHKLAAAKFLKKHQSTFLGNAEFANFIRQLANVTTPEEIARDEVVKTYLVKIIRKNRNLKSFRKLFFHILNDELFESYSKFSIVLRKLVVKAKRSCFRGLGFKPR